MVEPQRNQQNDSLYNRYEWLEQLGFESGRYPFGQNAYRAEDDTILEYPETFVFLPDLPSDKLLGDENDSGYTYFFAPNGAGKTSLRRYVKEYIVNNEPSTIIVEYVKGFKPETMAEADLYYATQIAKLICNQVKEIDIPEKNDAEDLLREVLQECHKVNVNRVYVLVDNVDWDFNTDFGHIEPLIANRYFLQIRGLRFKFFLNSKTESMLQELKNRYGYFPLKWTTEKLREVLSQRLTACVIEELRSSVTLGLLCDPDLASQLDEKLFDCIQIETPRELWEFVEKLIDVHFSGTTKHSSAELITMETFDKVCDWFRESSSKKRETETIDENSSKKHDINIRYAYGVAIGDHATVEQDFTKSNEASESVVAPVINGQRLKISDLIERHFGLEDPSVSI